MWGPNQEYDFWEDYKKGNITGRIPNFTPDLQPEPKGAFMRVWDLISFDYEAFEPLVDTIHELQRRQGFRVIKTRPMKSCKVHLTLGKASGRVYPEGREKETPSE